MGQKNLSQILKILNNNKLDLTKNYGIKEIAVFGSYTKGTQTKSSDVDIMVDFHKVPNMFKFIKLEEDLQRLLGKKIDLVRKQAIREELRENILGESVAV